MIPNNLIINKKNRNHLIIFNNSLIHIIIVKQIIKIRIFGMYLGPIIIMNHRNNKLLQVLSRQKINNKTEMIFFQVLIVIKIHKHLIASIIMILITLINLKKIIKLNNNLQKLNLKHFLILNSFNVTIMKNNAMEV